MKEKPWDFKMIRVDWTDFSIGAGFNLSTPRFKKRYSDEDHWRCISLILHFFGLSLYLGMPLFVDNPPTIEEKP